MNRLALALVLGLTGLLVAMAPAADSWEFNLAKTATLKGLIQW